MNDEDVVISRDAKALDITRLQGQLEAYAKALAECDKVVRSFEITGDFAERRADAKVYAALAVVDRLHKDTQKKLDTVNSGLRSTESAILDAKRAELRARMHEQGRYFIGEEILAKQHGGSIFDPRKGWNKK